MKTLMAHVLEPVPSPRAFDPNISPEIDAVVRHSMAKTPQARYPTASLYAREFRKTISPPQQSESTIYSDQVVPSSRFPDWLMPVGGGIFAALILSMAVTAIILSGGRAAAVFDSALPTATDFPSAAEGTIAPTLEPTIPIPTPGGGGRLVFASDRDGDYEIYLIEIDGQNLTQLTRNVSYDYAPDWSPDGQHIVFASSTDGDAEIKIMSADGSNVRILTSNFVTDTDPAWSPDGQWIAYSTSVNGTYKIAILRPNGSDYRIVTLDINGDALSPAWSPDSTQIVFNVSVNSDLSTAELHAVNIHSGVITRLTSNTVLDQWAHWSPDGTQLVYSSNQDATASHRVLRLLNLSTLESTKLTTDAKHDDDPTWSPDGRYIVFDSDRDNGTYYDLYMITISTGEIRQLTVNEANDVAPVWQPMP